MGCPPLALGSVEGYMAQGLPDLFRHYPLSHFRCQIRTQASLFSICLTHRAMPCFPSQITLASQRNACCHVILTCHSEPHCVPTRRTRLQFPGLATQHAVGTLLLVKPSFLLGAAYTALQIHPRAMASCSLLCPQVQLKPLLSPQGSPKLPYPLGFCSRLILRCSLLKCPVLLLEDNVTPPFSKTSQVPSRECCSRAVLCPASFPSPSPAY